MSKKISKKWIILLLILSVSVLAYAAEEKTTAEKEGAVVEKESEVVPDPNAYFFDDFNDVELAEHWEVINPNPDSFIVEDGSLLIVSGTLGSMAQESVENLFKLSKPPLPKDDWIITAKFLVEFQTGVERVVIGIVDSGDNYLETGVQLSVVRRSNNTRFVAINVEGIKRSRGKNKVSKQWIWSSPDLGTVRSATKVLPQPILLRLEKKGYGYIGSVMLAGAKEPRWVSLDKFTVLRQKGVVVVGLYQNGSTEGESFAKIDWVKIEVPEKPLND